MKFYSIHNQSSKILLNNLEVLIGFSFFVVSFTMLSAPQTTYSTDGMMIDERQMEKIWNKALAQFWLRNTLETSVKTASVPPEI
jgi:hypothetical protein